MSCNSQNTKSAQIDLHSRVIPAVALFSLLLFWRSPDLLRFPRFWAEEGNQYYANLQDQSLATALTLVIRGNFQLLTNLIAFAATLVPAEYAAHVSTYLALLISATLIAFLAALGHQNNWSLTTIALASAAVALLPHGYELYLTGTNVQWICSACVLILALLNADRWTKSQKITASLFTLTCGLTGVCSVMLAPLFLVRRITARSSLHFRLGLLLSGCAVVHVAVILTHPHPDRTFSTELFTLTFPIVLQTIFSPLFGANTVNQLLAFVGSETNSIIITSTYCIAFLVAAFSLTNMTPAENRSLLITTLAGAWIFVPMLNVFGSIGSPASLISGWGGARYFYIGAICLIISLGFATLSIHPERARLANALLALIVLTGTLQIYFGDWKNWLITGDSWKNQVIRCNAARPCAVEVWPGGEASRFQLTRP